MCGIFGYYQYNVDHSTKEVVDCLIRGLQRLEYRGYDSAGIAIDSTPLLDTFPTSPPPTPLPPPLVLKSAGKISSLASLVAARLPAATLSQRLCFHVGIAHTRWATHGAPCAANAHPHASDQDGDFVLVHNGIITNHAALRNFLMVKGFVFESDTDTEVIPKLCKYIYDSKEEVGVNGGVNGVNGGGVNGGVNGGGGVSFPDIVLEVMDHLEGAYALLIKSRHFPNELVACKKGSPLLLGLVESGGGVGGGGLARSVGGATHPHPTSPTSPTTTTSSSHPSFECYIASDASAIIEHTNKVILMEDGDLVHLQGPSYHCYTLSPPPPPSSSSNSTATPHVHVPPQPIAKSVFTLEMEVNEIMKGGYDHFMKKEIFEQPESLLQTMRGRVLFPGRKGGGGGGGEGEVEGEEGVVGMNGGGGGKDGEGRSLKSMRHVNGSATALSKRIIPTDSENEGNGGADTPPSLSCLTLSALTTTCSTTSSTTLHASLLPPPATHPSTTSTSSPPTSPLPTSSSSPSSCSIKLGGLQDRVDSIRRSSRLVLIACGSSYHACLATKSILEQLVDLPVSVEIGSDFIDRHCPIYRNDTCFFLSQSGETADTLHALHYAKQRGALCVGVVNTVGSAISRSTDCGVHINAGCEMGVASTKAYTSQIVVMTMIALLLSQDRLSMISRRQGIMEALFHLPSRVRQTLGLDSVMQSLALRLRDESSILLFGRGHNYATALEGALKVKEIAYMHSEGILAGEMKHGPLALVDEHLPLLVIATRDSLYQKMLSVVQQLRARSGKLIVMCTQGDDEIKLAAPEATLIEVPRTEECLQSIVNIVPLQLLAYHLAVARGYNVDQPRNLAKSVTVTD